MTEIPNDCVGYEEDLSALIDGELGAAREAEVRRHASRCARCSAQLDNLQRVGDALRAVPTPDLPWNLESRLRARIEEDRAERRRVVLGVAPRAPRRISPRLGIAAAVALAASLALLVVFGPRRSGDESTAPALRVARERPVPAPQSPRSVKPEIPEPPAEAKIAVEEPAPARIPTSAPSAPRRVAPPAASILASASDDELAVALDFETIDEFEIIDNLELLELLAVVDEPGASGERDQG
jgi:negative regulator of sigma E activity